MKVTLAAKRELLEALHQAYKEHNNQEMVSLTRENNEVWLRLQEDYYLSNQKVAHAAEAVQFAKDTEARDVMALTLFYEEHPSLLAHADQRTHAPRSGATQQPTPTSRHHYDDDMVNPTANHRHWDASKILPAYSFVVELTEEDLKVEGVAEFIRDVSQAHQAAVPRARPSSSLVQEVQPIQEFNFEHVQSTDSKSTDIRSGKYELMFHNMQEFYNFMDKLQKIPAAGFSNLGERLTAMPSKIQGVFSEMAGRFRGKPEEADETSSYVRPVASPFGGNSN